MLGDILKSNTIDGLWTMTRKEYCLLLIFGVTGCTVPDASTSNWGFKCSVRDKGTRSRGTCLFVKSLRKISGPKAAASYENQNLLWIKGLQDVFSDYRAHAGLLTHDYSCITVYF